MHKEPTPAAFDGIEMPSVERDAWADHVHVASAVVPQRLARAERGAMLGFQNYLLIEEEFLQFQVRCELEAERPDDLLEEVLQGLLSGFSIHFVPPYQTRKHSGACCQSNQCQGSLVCATAAGGAATCNHMRR